MDQQFEELPSKSNNKWIATIRVGVILITAAILFGPTVYAFITYDFVTLSDIDDILKYTGRIAVIFATIYFLIFLVLLFFKKDRQLLFLILSIFLFIIGYLFLANHSCWEGDYSSDCNFLRSLDQQINGVPTF